MSEPQLQLKLFPGWQVAENPEGPATYYREATKSGALQFSMAQHRGGQEPYVIEQDLLRIAHNVATSGDGAEILDSLTGTCAFGRFGAVSARAPNAFIWVWVLTNSRDFILATYTSTQVPDRQEFAEAEEIVLAATLGAKS